jgi:hypothetical protein
MDLNNRIKLLILTLFSIDIGTEDHEYHSYQSLIGINEVFYIVM